MNKILQQSQQSQWLSRLVEIIMQLRIDVKKELPEQLRKLMQQGDRHNEPAGSASLWRVELRESYDVKSKLGRGRDPFSECITIEFSLNNKQTAENEIV